MDYEKFKQDMVLYQKMRLRMLIQHWLKVKKIVIIRCYITFLRITLLVETNTI